MVFFVSLGIQSRENMKKLIQIILIASSFLSAQQKDPCIGEVLHNGKNIENRYLNYDSCRHTYFGFIKNIEEECLEDKNNFFNNDNWEKLISFEEDRHFIDRLTSWSCEYDVKILEVDSTHIYVHKGFMRGFAINFAIIAYDSNGNIWAIRTAEETDKGSKDLIFWDYTLDSIFLSVQNKPYHIYFTNVDDNYLNPPLFLKEILYEWPGWLIDD